jgi:hypothetical protein
MIALGDDLVGTQTHYYQGRTTPHREADCPACDAGQPSRWYGYLLVWSPKTKLRAILEITAASAEMYDIYRTQHGTLRAARVIVWRPNGKPNGRVKAILERSEFAANELPTDVDLRPILCRMWDVLDDTQTQTSGALKDARATMHASLKPNGKP